MDGMFERREQMTENTLNNEDIIRHFTKICNTIPIENTYGPETITENNLTVSLKLSGKSGLIFSNNKLELELNVYWWVNTTMEEKLVFYLHEATHLEERGHTEEFWQTNLSIYDWISEHKTHIENIFESELCWATVDWFFATTPKHTNTTNRKILREYQKKFEEEILLEPVTHY